MSTYLLYQEEKKGGLQRQTEGNGRIGKSRNGVFGEEKGESLGEGMPSFLLFFPIPVLVPIPPLCP